MIQDCLARRGPGVRLALAAASLVAMQLLLALRPGGAQASIGSAWPRPTIPPLPASEPGVATPIVSLDGPWYWTKTPPANFSDNTVDPSSDPSTWKTVPIPGDLAFLGLWTYCDEPCTTDKDVEYPYKKSIAIPADFAGRDIIIRFEAAQTMARVWANGHLVTTHRGAFSQWDADITPYVTPGSNAWITIGLTMEDHSPAFRHVRGITRDVTMIALPPNHASRLQATTTFDASYTNATLTVATGISFTDGLTGVVNLRLTDSSGADVPLSPSALSLSPSNPEGTAAIPVAQPKKWDAEHPYLYTLTATYKVDGTDVETVSKQIGFRTIVVSGAQLLVNGHPVKLHGVDYLPDAADRGINMTAASEDFHNLQEFKNANINYIRTSHMAPSEATLDAADKLGIYIEYESSVFFVGQGNGTNTQSDVSWLPEYVGQFAENIEADQTHPSILYWSLGNENTVWGSNMQAMLDCVRQADPTRPTKFSYGYAAPATSVDIYSVHYPGPGVVGLFTGTSEPVINDEYAHGFAPPAAGPTATKAFDPGTQDWYGAYLRQYWEPIYTTVGQLGGAIWEALDSYNQGPGYNGVNTWGTLLDAWGREKPEYDNVKKEYAPDYIADQAPLDNPGAGQPLLIPIQNRHDHTNLSEVTITYQAGAASGTISADVAPRARGYLTLPAQNWYAGETVALTFTNSAQAAILATNGITGYNPVEDVYTLTIGQPTPDFSGPTGPAPAITADSSRITVSNNATFSLIFDKATGLIANGTYKGTMVLTGGPILNLGNLAQSNQSLPAWSLSSITTTTLGNEAIVTVTGSYGSTGATFALHIDGTGLIRTAYTVTNPPSGSTEVGVAYEVTGAATTLTWQRRGIWSSYAADNIGRNVGVATEQNLTGAGAYGVRPAWSWSQDQKDYMDFGPNDPGNRGTNDFRSSKTNFITASLVVSGTNERLRAEGDATGSARAQVDGANIRFNINNLWSVTNQTPCCNSLFKTYSLPSTYANTVQMRLTDSDSAHTTTTYEPPTVSPGPNLAQSATVDAPGLSGDPRTIQDNDDSTGVPSDDNPTLPQDITYTWTTPQTFNQVLLSTTYAGGQGITNVDVEVSADGRTGWTQVAASGALTYATNDATVEGKTVSFPTQGEVKGLRIKINSANLEFNHYAIIEFKVFDQPTPTGATICGGLSAPPSPPAAVDLTAEGTADWSEWGATAATDFNHKANVPEQIGAFTSVGPGTDSQSGGGGTIATWSDGTPTPSGTNNQRGIFVAGAGNGFRLTLPADPITRTVRLYTNVFAARAAITATLSDGSAPAYSDDALVDTSDSFQNGAKAGVYTLSYSAASPGQTLTITLTTETDYGVAGSANQDGGVVLEAATLQQNTATSPTATPSSGTATATATTSPVATDTVTVTGTATTGPSVTSTSTPISPTGTTTATPTATGTITPATATSATASATATTTAVPPTVTTTSTAVPSTATNTAVPSTMTSTTTPVPATATNTTIPSTSTSTAVPPTATAVPPTVTGTVVPPTATSNPTALPVCQLVVLPAFDTVPRGGNQALLLDAAPDSAITLTVRAKYPASATLYTDSSLGASDGFGVTLRGAHASGDGYRYTFRVAASGLALLTFAIPHDARQGTVIVQIAAQEPCGVFKTVTTFQVHGTVRGAPRAPRGGAVTLAIVLPRGDTPPANAGALARRGVLRVTTQGQGARARRVLHITYHAHARPAPTVKTGATRGRTTHTGKAGAGRPRPHTLFGIAVGTGT